jgi:DNA-binding LacI/PurR family transcriptional regulator
MSDSILFEDDSEAALRKLVAQMSGKRLPGERELAVQLRISRPRLRSILAGLRAEGLIEQRPGSGTYAVSGTARLRRVALISDSRLKLGDDPFFSHLIECLQNAVQAVGARCVVERTDGSGEDFTLEDGALTLGLAGQAVMNQLRPGASPVVGLLLPPNSRAGRRASVFELDDQEAGRDAGRALIAEGCTEILFVGRRDIPASRERWEGVEEAAQNAGVPVRLIDCHLNYAAGLTLGRTLPLPPGRVGLVATNDWLAVGLHIGLMQQDAARARDLPFVSFDGLRLAADSSLGIRSLAVPIETIAEDAVAELARLSRSPISTGRVVRYPLQWTL